MCAIRQTSAVHFCLTSSSTHVQAMLSFEEFSAVRNRRRQLDRAQDNAPRNITNKNETVAPTSDEKASTENSDSSVSQQDGQGNDSSNKDNTGRRRLSVRFDLDPQSPSGRGSKSGRWSKSGKGGTTTLQHGGGLRTLGVFVELYEVQLLMVMLILIDIVLCTVELLIVRGGRLGSGEGAASLLGKGSTQQWLLAAVYRAMVSLSGFTAFFFVFEVTALALAFRLRFFQHLGYVLDLFIVGLCLYGEIFGLAKEIRLLGYLRGWRVIRLCNTLLAQEKEQAVRLREALAAEQQRIAGLQAEKLRLVEALRQEGDARKRTETLLRDYKDEVETLQEALQIAALDIAVAATGTDDEYSDNAYEEEGIGEDSGEETEKGAPDPGGTSSRSKGKRGLNGSGSDRAGAPDRIFVSDDGTWSLGGQIS